MPKKEYKEPDKEYKEKVEKIIDKFFLNTQRLVNQLCEALLEEEKEEEIILN